MRNRSLLRLTLLSALLSPTLALATNGYFSHGYGIKSQGIAGIGIALPQDALAAATNPAGTAFVGDRIDVGVSWFRPSRGAEIRGSGNAAANGSFSGDDSENFAIPEGGFTRQLSPSLGVGVAVYGNGGMNTNYGNNPFRAYGGTGAGGVNLSQLFISPSVAYKLNDNHAIGLAVNFGYQRFSAKGLGPNFAANSASPNNFDDKGVDTATGWGARIGWTGKITQTLTLGATWASKTRFSAFDKYKGLFAESGDFDAPANYGIGAAWQATPALTLALDVQRIEYSKVKSVGNPLSNLSAVNLFGTANGPGFGWRDVTVTKFGASYDLSSDLALRAGYSYATKTVPESETFLNILAPGVIRHHLTLGGTWKHGKNGELSFAYTHGFKETVNGHGSIPSGFGGGEANVHLKEDILGIAYGWKI